MSKILVVEDDSFLRELLVNNLTREGFETDGAETGEDGVRKIQDSRPDLILLDIMLPGMDGFEVLGWMRRNKDYSEVPVIFLSNLGDKQDIKRGMDLGATDYLVKANFTPPEIFEKVRSILPA